MGVVRLVTFDFWQPPFADTPGGLARGLRLAVGMRAAHCLPDGGPGGGASDAVVRHFAELPAVLTRLG